MLIRINIISCEYLSGSQAAVGLFRWIGRSPRLINDINIIYRFIVCLVIYGFLFDPFPASSLDISRILAAGAGHKIVMSDVTMYLKISFTLHSTIQHHV